MIAISLDPGHGKKTYGKCSPPIKPNLLYGSSKGNTSIENGRYREYLFNHRMVLSITRKIINVKRELLNKGYLKQKLSVFCTVNSNEFNEGTDVPLTTRMKRVNDLCSKYGDNNVLSYSCHTNAAGEGWSGVYSYSVHYLQKAKGRVGKNPKSPLVAKTVSNVFKEYLLNDFVYKSFHNYTTIPQTQIKYHEYDQVLAMCGNGRNGIRCPSVLVETFFHTNEPDIRYSETPYGFAILTRCAVIAIFVSLFHHYDAFKQNLTLNNLIKICEKHCPKKIWKG